MLAAPTLLVLTEWLCNVAPTAGKVEGVHQTLTETGPGTGGAYPLAPCSAPSRQNGALHGGMGPRLRGPRCKWLLQLAAAEGGCAGESSQGALWGRHSTSQYLIESEVPFWRGWQMAENEWPKVSRIRKLFRIEGDATKIYKAYSGQTINKWCPPEYEK